MPGVTFRASKESGALNVSLRLEAQAENQRCAPRLRFSAFAQCAKNAWTFLPDLLLFAIFLLNSVRPISRLLFQSPVSQGPVASVGPSSRKRSGSVGVIP